MGLFGFLKKEDSTSAKPGVVVNQNIGKPATAATNKLTSTKVDDGKGSFEIPDFNEEDLNFDLGLNEFMAAKDDIDKSLKVPQSNVQEMPKGKLQQDQEEQKEVKENPFDGMVINTKELNTEALSVGKDKVTGDSLGNSFPDQPTSKDPNSWGNHAKKFPQDEKVKKEEFTKQDTSKQDELIPEDLQKEDDFDFNMDDFNALKDKSSDKPVQTPTNPKKPEPVQKPEDALPKFDVKPSLDLEKERSKKNQTFGDYLKKDAKKNLQPKQEAPSFDEIKRQKYELPNEVDKKGDIFIDKKKYKNMIIVADLIKEEVETVFDLDINLAQASQTQEDNYEELRDSLNFIKDTLLQIDKKIFEEGDQ